MHELYKPATNRIIKKITNILMNHNSSRNQLSLITLVPAESSFLSPFRNLYCSPSHNFLPWIFPLRLSHSQMVSVRLRETPAIEWLFESSENRIRGRLNCVLASSYFILLLLLIYQASLRRPSRPITHSGQPFFTANRVWFPSNGFACCSSHSEHHYHHLWPSREIRHPFANLPLHLYHAPCFSCVSLCRVYCTPPPPSASSAFPLPPSASSFHPMHPLSRPLTRFALEGFSIIIMESDTRVLMSSPWDAHTGRIWDMLM